MSERAYVLEQYRDQVTTVDDALNDIDRSKCQDTQTFYEAKLATLWAKCRLTAAGAGLAEFSWRAFVAQEPVRKSSLREHPWDFVRIDLSDASRYYQTSGTTGRPTPTPRSATEILTNAVSVAESWRTLIARKNARALSMIPSDVVPAGDLIVGVCEHLRIPVTRAYPFSMGMVDWDVLFGLIETLRPTVLFSAPGVLLQLTQIAKRRHQLDQLSTSLETVMLLGEVSTPTMRAMLGRNWNAAVFDASYGSTESGTLATCCLKDRLHVLTAANLVELEINGRVLPLDPGSVGNLIATPLNADARPLLRMEMGDEVEVGSCDCGRDGPTIKVRGRASDRLLVKDSLLDTYGLETVVYSATQALGYMIEMTESGSYARLLLERDPDTLRSAEPSQIEALQNESTERLGFSWDGVVFVNDLPSATRSGGSLKSWKRSNVAIVSAASEER